MHCGAFRVVVWGLLFWNFQLVLPEFLQALAPTSSLKTGAFSSHNMPSLKGGLLGGNSDLWRVLEKAEALKKAVSGHDIKGVYQALREFRAISPDSLKNVVPVVNDLMAALGEGSPSLPGILRRAIAEDLLEYAHRLFIQNLEGNVTSDQKKTLINLFGKVRKAFAASEKNYEPRFLLSIETLEMILDTLPDEPDKLKKASDVAQGLVKVAWGENYTPLFEFASWVFKGVKGKYSAHIYQTLLRIRSLSQTAPYSINDLNKLQKVFAEKSTVRRIDKKIGQKIPLFYIQALTDVILKTGNARIRNQAYYGVLTSKNGIMKKRYGLILLLEKYLSKCNITITQTIIESLFVIADNKGMTNGIKSNAVKRLRVLEKDSRFRFVFDEKREILGFSKRLAQAQREPTAEELSRQRIFSVLDQIFEKELAGQIKLEEIDKIVMNINDQKQVFIQEIKNLEGKIDRNYEGINRTHQATVGVRNQVNGLHSKANRLFQGQQAQGQDIKVIKDYVIPDPAADEKKVEALIEALYRNSLKDMKKIKAFQYYVRPEGADNLEGAISLDFKESSSNRFDLEEKVMGFLEGRTRSFVLLGDGGFGKTTFGRNLEKVLWKKYVRDKKRGLDVSWHWIPLYIHLKNINLVKGEYLKQFFYSLEDDKGRRIIGEAELELLRRSKYRFFVIFDEFDEVLAQENLYNSGGLSQWPCKVMFLSRVKHLSVGGFDHLFKVKEEKALTNYVGFLTPEQQGEYIRNYVFSNITKNRQEKLENILNYLENSLETLDILLTLLELEEVLNILLKLMRDPEHGQGKKIRRLDIYSHLAARWFDREYKRMVLLLKEEKVDPVQGAKNFQKVLRDMSWVMFEKDTLILDERKLWAQPFLKRRTLGLTGSQTYQKEEDVFQFMDETLRDYYAVQALLFDLGYDKQGKFREKPLDFSRWQKKTVSSNMVGFLVDILDEEGLGFYMGLQEYLREMGNQEDQMGQKNRAALNAQLVLAAYQESLRGQPFSVRQQSMSLSRELWLDALRKAA